MTRKSCIVFCFFASVCISGCGQAAANACMAEADTAYRKLKSVGNISYEVEQLLTSSDMAASQKTEVLADYTNQNWYRAYYSDSVMYKEELSYEGIFYCRMARTGTEWIPGEASFGTGNEMNVLDGLQLDSECISSVQQEKSGAIIMKLSDAGLKQLQEQNLSGANGAYGNALESEYSTEQDPQQNPVQEHMEGIRYMEGEVQMKTDEEGVLTSYAISLKLSVPEKDGAGDLDQEMQAVYRFNVKSYDQPQVIDMLAKYLSQD